MFETLVNKLQSDGPYITLETTPSKSPQFTPTVEKIAALGLDTMVDGFSTTDNPLAKLKYNAMFAARLLQARFNKPVLATVSMRDRNLIALQSDLLGANEANVRAILALTGDPAKMSDQPNAKGVFQGNSSMMLDIISCFNSGIDYAGKPLQLKPEPIYPFAVIDSYAKNPATLMKKMQRKINHKALGIITQPVYDLENAKMLLELLDQAKANSPIESINTQLIIGIFPITKLRTAQFLASHVPGIHVPPHWVEQLRIANAHSAEEEYKVGFDLSKQLFENLKSCHPKIHLMTANQFELAQKILS